MSDERVDVLLQKGVWALMATLAGGIGMAGYFWTLH